mmetsp:Transcript_9643/g.24850  ORF Transcript_9643/g.24850 Transcript_9643/m.24850 type:complete len:255 (-) Transcript_9643:701-1465(-)
MGRGEVERNDRRLCTRGGGCDAAAGGRVGGGAVPLRLGVQLRHDGAGGGVRVAVVLWAHAAGGPHPGGHPGVHAEPPELGMERRGAVDGRPRQQWEVVREPRRGARPDALPRGPEYDPAYRGVPRRPGRHPPAGDRDGGHVGAVGEHRRVGRAVHDVPLLPLCQRVRPALGRLRPRLLRAFARGGRVLRAPSHLRPQVLSLRPPGGGKRVERHGDAARLVPPARLPGAAGHLHRGEDRPHRAHRARLRAPPSRH